MVCDKITLTLIVCVVFRKYFRVELKNKILLACCLYTVVYVIDILRIFF